MRAMVASADRNRRHVISDPLRTFTTLIGSALGGGDDWSDALEIDGEGALPSAFAVSDLAATAIGAAGLAVAELVEARHGRRPAVRVDRRLASFWFASSIRPRGWTMPAIWDPIAGDYRADDGWIRLHTNAPHHRAAAERVLGAHADRESMAPAVARWRKGELEAAIVAEGGCAAEMRSLEEWAAHAQGRAVADEPLVSIDLHRAGSPPSPGWPVPRDRPLAGVRVLDLTRVLAGPVASRFLAGFGADVLRIDPPGWDEPSIVPEVTLGKRCARLDLRVPTDRAQFESLIADADVLLHGYRSDALAHLGYDADVRRRLRPGLVDVCLDAYGWTGPWRTRRGFDSLVQMSAGIAHEGMRWRYAEVPVPLPVQALDHATGYLIAATAVRGLVRRLGTGAGCSGRLSLARTAKLLVDAGAGRDTTTFAKESREDRADGEEATPWGSASRLKPPVRVDGAPMRWDLPASALGSASPTWPLRSRPDPLSTA